MTDPRRYLIRMIIFLVAVLVIAGLLAGTLVQAFLGNVTINSVILIALVIGIIFIFRQTLRLQPEVRWMRSMLGETKIAPPTTPPSLLATVAVLFADGKQRRRSVSAQALRSILDGVAVRLDESREIARYLIGLLVFLGLLGTFWGLLQTVQSVSLAVNSIDLAAGSISALVGQLKSGLDGPLAGMATAFSSSLFGLAGSLVLGFLDLQLGQASGRFYTEVEDWLSQSVQLNDPTTGSSGTTALATGLSEAAAERMAALADAVRSGEADRQAINAQLASLIVALTQLNSTMERDNSIVERLAGLEASIQILAQEMRNDRRGLNDTISDELRALGHMLASRDQQEKPGGDSK